MTTLTFFLILLGASGLFSRKAETEGLKPKGKLVGNYYEAKVISSIPASQSVPAPPEPISGVTVYHWLNIQPDQPFIRINQNEASSPDGNFFYSFKTDNGIYVKASGYLRYLSPEEPGAQVMDGVYSYKAPDGTLIVNRWYADETGFHPKVTYN